MTPDPNATGAYAPSDSTAAERFAPGAVAADTASWRRSARAEGVVIPAMRFAQQTHRQWAITASLRGVPL